MFVYIFVWLSYFFREYIKSETVTVLHPSVEEVPFVGCLDYFRKVDVIGDTKETIVTNLMNPEAALYKSEYSNRTIGQTYKRLFAGRESGQSDANEAEEIRPALAFNPQLATIRYKRWCIIDPTSTHPITAVGFPGKEDQFALLQAGSQNSYELLANEKDKTLLVSFQIRFLALGSVGSIFLAFGQDSVWYVLLANTSSLFSEILKKNTYYKYNINHFRTAKPINLHFYW